MRRSRLSLDGLRFYAMQLHTETECSRMLPLQRARCCAGVFVCSLRFMYTFTTHDNDHDDDDDVEMPAETCNISNYPSIPCTLVCSLVCTRDDDIMHYLLCSARPFIQAEIYFIRSICPHGQAQKQQQQLPAILSNSQRLGMELFRINKKGKMVQTRMKASARITHNGQGKMCWVANNLHKICHGTDYFYYPIGTRQFHPRNTDTNTARPFPFASAFSLLGKCVTQLITPTRVVFVFSFCLAYVYLSSSNMFEQLCPLVDVCARHVNALHI